MKAIAIILTGIVSTGCTTATQQRGEQWVGVRPISCSEFICQVEVRTKDYYTKRNSIPGRVAAVSGGKGTAK